MFLFIDNYDSFSYNIVQYFQQLGQSPTVITNDNPKLLELANSPELEAVILSPGPSTPRNAGYCLEFLRRLPRHIPVLGICLGHQCLGYFAGCPVVRGTKVMHGKTSNIEHDGTGLYRGVSSPMQIGRYHSLVVRCPDDHPLIDVTARDEDGEVMSLRFKDRPWVGVQYHPESILTPQGMRLLQNFPRSILRNMTISSLLETLADGHDLTPEQADQAFADLMDGKMTPAQAGAFLLTLRAKGETTTEVSAAVRAALERSQSVDGIRGEYVDIVGTGGDGKKSFNCSTATAIIMAGLGYQVVKHGNRAVSSSSGAADVLESLGYPLNLDAGGIRDSLRHCGFAFEFAPRFHPSFKNIGPIRKDLGTRTLFNLLGPLINPSRPTHMMLGVSKPELVPVLAEVLAQGAYKRAIVLCGAGGYDEATTFGPATAYSVTDSIVEPMEIDPAALGFEAAGSEDDLRVDTAEEARETLLAILAGRGPKPMMDMVALNVALCISIFEPDTDRHTCVARARRALEEGVGLRVIENWKTLKPQA